MPIDIKILCRQISPERAVVFFGAGSSIPSGGLSGAQLAERIAVKFGIENDTALTLSEVSTISEKLSTRKELIAFLRSLISDLSPTGSLMNLPLFPWKAIYTTNYDRLIEVVYERKSKQLDVFSSNFDFSGRHNVGAVNLYKIHGTIERDVSDGSNSRIIITAGDYDHAHQYREMIFDKLKMDMSDGDLIIVGHSLSDGDIKPIIEEALRRKRDSGASGKIFLLLNIKDTNRAMLYEDRGLIVCFGGLDEFFAEMSLGLPPQQLALCVSDDPLDVAPALRPCTVDVAHAMANGVADVLKMFNGRPAGYPDVVRNWTFEREVAQQIEGQLAGENERIAYVLGVAGVGKTSAVRQALLRLSQRGILCWEHKDDFALSDDKWKCIDDELRRRKLIGVLFVDDCHNHMREVSRLSDAISMNESPGLKLVLVSTKHHWNTRVKTPAIFSHGKHYELKSLTGNEINGLLDLLEGSPEVRGVVEDRFLGFSRPERRRRLEERCAADMFVCMKNIFGFESIDNIILREYAGLSEAYQDIYRTVAAMEAAGVRVHRQLIIRTLGIKAQAISGLLENMTGLIDEDTINEKYGLYGWRCRHGLIAEIVSKYKFSDQDEVYALFDKVIGNLNPTYDIEVRTIRDMCDIRAGIGRITDVRRRNYLLRRMISLAPGERVPRHRLISNLIELGHYEECDNEIRIFEKELRADAPVHRYKIKVIVAKAVNTPGIMDEDRAALLKKAGDLALDGIRFFQDDKNSYSSFLDVGLKFARLMGKWSIFDEAMEKAKEAENRIMDPELRRIISAYEHMAQKVTCG